MTTEKVRDWLRIGTDLAVVVGLFLVILQIHANTSAQVAANINTITDQSLTFFQAGLDNQIVAAAIQKQTDRQPLSPLERSQLARLQYLNFRGFENAFQQYRRGYYPRQDWERYRGIIRQILATDSIAIAEIDRARGWGFTQEFQQELDDIRARPH